MEFKSLCKYVPKAYFFECVARARGCLFTYPYSQAQLSQCYAAENKKALAKRTAEKAVEAKMVADAAEKKEAEDMETAAAEKELLDEMNESVVLETGEVEQ